MSGTTGGGVTVPTVPVPVSMGGTGSATGDAILNSITFGGFTNNKKLYSDVNNSLVLLNGTGGPELTVDSGGSLAAVGNITTFGQLFTADGQGGGAGLRRVPRANSTTTNPGVSNDTTQGYSVGSRWVNTSSGQFWSCEDSTTGAAVWVPMSPADHPGYLSGRKYPPTGVTAATGTAGAISTIYYVPFTPKTLITPQTLLLKTSAGGATTHRMAIWKNDLATMQPIATVPTVYTTADSASMTTSNTFYAGTLNASVAFPPGVPIWIGYILSTITATYIGVSGTGFVLPSVFGVDAGTGTSQPQCWSQTGTYGSLSAVTPSGLSATTQAGAVPLPFIGT